ncbi:response regulator transcription factor [Anaerolineales bacterium]
MVTSAPEQIYEILVVEDEEETAELVCSILNEAGHLTQFVSSGEDALEVIREIEPDLIILDIDLPGINGHELLSHIRGERIIPVIVLSGWGKDKERVMALDLGADDFISKPFSKEELVARVHALMRRVLEWTPVPDTRMRVRDLELDISRRQASIRNKRLHLTPNEYDILILLMKNSGKVVSHEYIMENVWGESITDFSVLRVNISRLRNKIEEQSRRPLYIVTVPGQGYWMPVDKP